MRPGLEVVLRVDKTPRNPDETADPHDTLGYHVRPAQGQLGKGATRLSVKPSADPTGPSRSPNRVPSVW